MRWDDRRVKLADLPLEGWWDRTAVSVNQAINNGDSTDNLYGDEFEKRGKVHRDILDEHLELALQHPVDKKFVMIGGLPSSGKSRWLDANCPNYVVVSPDMFKEVLIERGLVPDISNVTPMETGSLCHAESAWLAKKFFYELVELEVNIALDFTMNYPDSVTLRLQATKDRGYFNECVFLEISKGESKRRVVDRHLDGVIKFLDGEGLGGRYVPLQYIAGVDPAKCFKVTKQYFDKARLFDATGAKPVLEGSW